MRLSLLRYVCDIRRSFAVIGLALLVPIAVAGQLCYSPMAQGAISPAPATASMAGDPCCDLTPSPANCLATAYYESKPGLLSGNSLDFAWIEPAAISLRPAHRVQSVAPAFIVQTGPPLRRSVLYCRYLI